MLFTSFNHFLFSGMLFGEFGSWMRARGSPNGGWIEDKAWGLAISVGPNPGFFLHVNFEPRGAQL